MSVATKGYDMPFETRRIVTMNDPQGTAYFHSDETITSAPRGVGAGIEGCEMWSTDTMPVDNGAADEARQRAGVVRKHNYVGSGAGSTFRITQWQPGHALFPHRTSTIDYAIMLSGELDLELDDGACVTLRPGDVVIQRGTIHCWINRSEAPATIAFILLDASPFETAQGQLESYFPKPPSPS